MLKIALPNKGALSQGAIDLIKSAGYKLKKGAKELYCTDAVNGIEFYFLRPTDIATYVDSGVFTFGITGRDILADSDVTLEEVVPLNFGRARMHYIIPQEQQFTGVEQFAGKRIACSYPTLIKNHLEANNVDAKIIELDGAVEISIHLGIADVVADVVETGTTIRQAGLKTVGEPVMRSEAILISKDNSFADNPVAETFIKRLNGIIVARRHVMLEYDLPTEKLDQAFSITKGLESPTVAPLHENGWSAVKVLIASSELNDCIDSLEEIGARGIIATEIRTCRL